MPTDPVATHTDRHGRTRMLPDATEPRRPPEPR
jgi:hypothetical protein